MICAHCQQPLQEGETKCPRCGAFVSVAASSYAALGRSFSPFAVPAGPPKPPERQVWQPPRRDLGDSFDAPSSVTLTAATSLGPSSLASAVLPAPRIAPEPAPVPTPPVLSAARLFGFFLLMCLPLVGLLCACVWAFGRRTGLQLKNLARAALLFLLTVWVLLAAAAWWAITVHLPTINAIWEALFR